MKNDASYLIEWLKDDRECGRQLSFYAHDGRFSAAQFGRSAIYGKTIKELRHNVEVAMPIRPALKKKMPRLRRG